MSKHTPGPWVIDAHLSSDGWDVNSTGKGQSDGWSAICECVPNSLGASIVNNETAEANARLIAAAPELLEALQAFVVLYDQSQLQIEGDNGNDPVIQEARAAIAKATGEAP